VTVDIVPRFLPVHTVITLVFAFYGIVRKYAEGCN